jgi:hypothetical protein
VPLLRLSEREKLRRERERGREREALVWVLSVYACDDGAQVRVLGGMANADMLIVFVRRRLDLQELRFTHVKGWPTADFDCDFD